MCACVRVCGAALLIFDIAVSLLLLFLVCERFAFLDVSTLQIYIHIFHYCIRTQSRALFPPTTSLPPQFRTHIYQHLPNYYKFIGLQHIQPHYQTTIQHIHNNKPVNQLNNILFLELVYENQRECEVIIIVILFILSVEFCVPSFKQIGLEFRTERFMVFFRQVCYIID